MDVVINNFRPGVMDRMGLGYEKLKEINPRIIFASGSGFGDSGPNVSKGGQDVLAQAMTGVMTRKPDNSNPTAIFGTTLCDYTAGMHLVQGILAALLMREKTGEGQMVKVSLYDSMLAMQMQEAAMILEENYELNWSAMPLTGAFETSDGALVLVGAFKPNPLQDICRVLGLEDLSKTYSDFDSQRANKKLIQDSFRKAFLKNTTEYWLERLEEEDLLCAPIRNLREALDDPQTKHNEMVADVPLNNNLTARLIGSPVKLSAVQFKVRHSPPDLGQDTHNILQEYGFDDSQIKAMKDQGDLG
jgi:formyl-CoA transferase